jgi:ribosome-associated toxin RatA of RatAB toxin-antitoxin module
VTPALARSLLALAVLAGGLVTAAWPASLRALPEDVRNRLTAGEVIVSDTLPPGASPSARGGTALALVRAAPEQVWRVLVDYPGHPRYYPRVVAAEVVGGDADRVVVRYHVGLGPFSFNFHMDKFPDARRRRIHWHLAEGNSHGLFRENSGYWQVEAADAASLVTYAIAVRTMLPTFVTGGAERASLTETLSAMRKLAEAGDAARPPVTAPPGAAGAAPPR